MSRFNPTRTSSPLVRARAQTTASVSTPAPKVTRPASEEISTSSAKSLQQLTPHDVQIIDAIIERAPASAKAFVAVYKAYNAVLQERGLNPSDDVIYYEFLLKLGLVKGAEWGDKWATAKAQLNLGGVETSAPDNEPPPPLSPSPPFATPAPLSSLRTPGPSSQATRTPRYRARFVDDTPASNQTPSLDNPPEAPEPSHASANLQRLLRKLTAVDSSSTTGRTETSSIATPSSRVSNLAMAHPVRSKGKEPATPRPSTRPPVRIAEPLDGATPARQPLGYRSRFTTPNIPASSREKVTAPAIQVKREESVEPTARSSIEEPPRRNGINEPDTWRLIKMEKDADHFRNDRLLEKFFSLWKQNTIWIRDTTLQISEARRKLALRERFTQWQDKSRARLDMARRAARVDAYFTQRRVLLHWRQVAGKRRRQQWQVDMKRKLRTVRTLVDKRILRQAWERWRQVVQPTAALEQAEGFYDATVLHRCIVHWAQRLQAVRVLPVRALEFRAARNKTLLNDIFDAWKSRAELRVMERMTLVKRDHRIKKEVFLRWSKDTHLHHAARNLHDRHVLRSMFIAWKSKAKRVRALERRANDYVRRQNRILLHAIHRVWVAKARGEQLTRVNNAQLLKDALSVWRNRVVEVQSLEAKAVALIQQADRDLLVRAFHVIRNRIQTFREEEVFAARHYEKQLITSALATWREAAALRRKQARQARIARRFFVERSCFSLWRAALVQKRLAGLEHQLKREKLRSALQVWKGRLKRHIMLKRMGDVVQGMVEQRIAYNALKKWIGAVVENKLQLLQAVDERNNRLQRLAFDKWKEVKRRHQEEMSLLRSFQDVKREDMIRRTFQKWLSVSRHAQHRRQSLERKEQQIRLDALGRVWDVWRDRFKEGDLQAVALPALRLYASNVRRKAFEKWRASLPSAKLARVAREFEKEKVLGKMLTHWRERYQTKIGLKAVARARYLRLPPAAVAPRPSVLSSAAASRAGPASRPVLPSSSAAPTPAHIPRATAVSLLGRKTVSERAASTAPETRAPSPATTVARARSRSPVKAVQTPKPPFVATPAPAPTPPTRASLLSGFRVTPRPARTGPFGSGPTASASVQGETVTTVSEGAQPPLSSAGTPFSERPSRLVGRRFVR
ncbi:hypothetical protein FRC06_001530 [Ceratobasidium sp. 370]|nr:hypothetical protein FRC06_001530 [Ceratobasidium sp. 370]